MMSRVRVLMTGPSLTHRNQGDNLLYFVVGDIIRAHYEGNVEIVAFSATREPDRITAQAPWLRIINPRRNPFRAIATLFSVDAYFIAGAIPFHDNFRLMLQQFLYAVIVKMRGRRFIVNAVSVQPIVKPACKRLFRWTERLADSFSVRDAEAQANAESLGARTPVARTVDPGMLCKPASPQAVDILWRGESLPAGVPVCGIGPHVFVNRTRYFDSRYEFKIEYQDFSDQELDAYYDSMAATADMLAERGPVVFFSLSTRMPPGDDREACEWIVRRMKRPERAHIVRGEYTAAELMGMLGRLDHYVSTRLHGYALALGAGVPTVAIEFHAKMRGLAQELGVEDWVVPFQGITGDAVTAVSASVLDNLDANRGRLTRNLRAATSRAITQIVDTLPPPR
jgi:polysaccharide pyruvyl transferase WcaK-like protein